RRRRRRPRRLDPLRLPAKRGGARSGLRAARDHALSCRQSSGMGRRPPLPKRLVGLRRRARRPAPPRASRPRATATNAAAPRRAVEDAAVPARGPTGGNVNDVANQAPSLPSIRLSLDGQTRSEVPDVPSPAMGTIGPLLQLFRLMKGHRGYALLTL